MLPPLAQSSPITAESVKSDVLTDVLTGVKQLRLLIADEDARLRAEVVQALRPLGYQVDEAPSYQVALQQLSQTSYHLFVLDLKFALDLKDDGNASVSIMQQVKALYPNMLLLVTAYQATVNTLLTAIHLHVADYLLKPLSVIEITDAIIHSLHEATLIAPISLGAYLARSAAAQMLTPTPTSAPPKNRNLAYAPILRVGRLQLDCDRQVATLQEKQPRTVFLTQSEAILLATLMKEPERVFACRHLARAAFNYELDEHEAQILVRPAISRLRQKFEPLPKSISIIRTVRGRGYFLGAI